MTYIFILATETTKHILSFLLKNPEVVIAVGGGVSVLIIMLNIAILVILLTQRTKIKAMKGK